MVQTFQVFKTWKVLRTSKTELFNNRRLNLWLFLAQVKVACETYGNRIFWSHLLAIVKLVYRNVAKYRQIPFSNNAVT